MSDYDSWLLKQADKYCTYCEPMPDKNGEYTKCTNCFDNDECELWQELQR